MKTNVNMAPKIVWLCKLSSFFKFFKNAVKFTNHKTPNKGRTNRDINSILNFPSLCFYIFYHTAIYMIKPRQIIFSLGMEQNEWSELASH